MSRISGEQSLESLSTGTKHDSSTLASKDNSKYDMQSPDVIASTLSTSAKSDISTEVVLPLGKGSFQTDGRRNHLNTDLDNFHAVRHDSQQNTESSCSNSLSAILPVSLSINGSQETSKDAYSFENSGGSIAGSNSKAFDRRSHEPVTGSSESGVSDCIARRAVRNARTGNSIKMSSVVRSCSPSLKDKGDVTRQDDAISPEGDHTVVVPDRGPGEVVQQTNMSMQVSGNSSCTEVQHASAIGKALFSSEDSDNTNFLDRTVQHIRSSYKCDTLHHSHSGETISSLEVSRGNKDVLVVKGNPPVDLSPGLINQGKTGFQRNNESSESSMSKTCKFVGGFDLNEDINASGTDGILQPVVATTASHNVIHVVAKAMVPTGLPMIPLKFEGGMGWKGSAETSAFRPAVLSKSLDKTCDSSNDPHRGFDLNVAAVEDGADKGLFMEHERIDPALSPLKSQSETGLKQRVNLTIDLNYSCDADDEFVPQSSFPCESETPPLMDLNLNANTSSEDTHNDVHWLGKSRQSLRNTTLDFLSNSGKRNFYFTGQPNLTALGNTQDHGHAQQYLVAVPNVPLQSVEFMHRVAPLQQKMSYIPHNLSTGQGPYEVHPSSIHCSSIMPYPYAKYPHEQGIPPELLNPGRINSFGAPHVVPVGHGHSFVTPASKVDVRTDGHLSLNESKMDEAGRPFFPAKGSAMEEHVKSLHQGARYNSPMKRKEPEGGFEYYQFGYRQ